MMSDNKENVDGNSDYIVYDVGIVGCGRMGASISGQLALCGAKVVMYDRTDFDRHKGLEIMRADLKSHVDANRLLPWQKDFALSNVSLAESIREVCRSRIVVEVIFEDLEAKRKLFADMEQAAESLSTVFATNSINFTIAQICERTVSPRRTVCGLRFMHPVFFIRQIEMSSPEATCPPRLEVIKSWLMNHNFQPFFATASPGFYRRKLTLEDADGAMLRQEELTRQNQDQPPNFVVKPPRVPIEECPECIICLERRADSVLAPCGHENVCMVCAVRVLQNNPLPRCPTCRQKIERILERDFS